MGFCEFKEISLPFFIITISKKIVFDWSLGPIGGYPCDHAVTVTAMSRQARVLFHFDKGTVT